MFILTDNSGKILYQCKYKQIGFVLSLKSGSTSINSTKWHSLY